LSKTKKVAKMTSEISSSARITGAVFCVAIPPVPIEADAPLASDNAPATPNAVTALLRPFALEIGFECDISDLSGLTPNLGLGADVQGSNK
jgi:hypothetical protein